MRLVSVVPDVQLCLQLLLDCPQLHAPGSRAKKAVVSMVSEWMDGGDAWWKDTVSLHMHTNVTMRAQRVEASTTNTTLGRTC